MAKPHGNNGYTVSKDLLDDLIRDLATAGIRYVVVDEPTGLGTIPRPIYVTSDPSPKGWTRYGRCRRCNQPRGLTTVGRVSNGCRACFERKQRTVDHHRIWKMIESNSPVDMLGLPGWIESLGVTNVAAVRDRLREGNLENVGAERAPIVDSALRAFRERVLLALNEGG